MFVLFVLLVIVRGEYYVKVENFGTYTSFVSAQGIFASDQDGNIYATDQTSTTSSVLRKLSTYGDSTAVSTANAGTNFQLNSVTIEASTNYIYITDSTSWGSILVIKSGTASVAYGRQGASTK